MVTATFWEIICCKCGSDSDFFKKNIIGGNETATNKPVDPPLKSRTHLEVSTLSIVFSGIFQSRDQILATHLAEWNLKQRFSVPANVMLDSQRRKLDWSDRMDWPSFFIFPDV